MTRLGAGIIGLGVGEQHAAGYRAHPEVDLVALCDRDPGKLALVGQRHPGVRTFARAEDLIADPRVQIVSVASQDDDHFAQIVRALDAGKHVFAEKPLCLTAEEAAGIRAALARNPGCRLSSNTILRLSPRFRGLRDDIAAGRFGRVFAAEADYNFGRLAKLTEGWRGRIPNYSVMLGGGIHMVDLLLWLLGGRVVEVMAYGNNISSAGSVFRGADLVMALLRFADGAVGKVAANFGCVVPHFHRLTVYGTAATFENGRDAGLLWTSRDPAEAPARVETAYPGIGKGDLIPGFIDAILGRGRAGVEEADVFAALAVCFAIDRSLSEGRPVTVADI